MPLANSKTEHGFDPVFLDADHIMIRLPSGESQIHDLSATSPTLLFVASLASLQRSDEKISGIGKTNYYSTNNINILRTPARTA
jgi:hypothetical protein